MDEATSYIKKFNHETFEKHRQEAIKALQDLDVKNEPMFVLAAGYVDGHQYIGSAQRGFIRMVCYEFMSL